ncbi:hypothetical protein CEXT_184451 [Caerostris extrusa]|uniref:Uncharacterized protein n=1 Tax=Caerostris extrusa TaxID=172846 RepID=A0AAV4VQJ8_CAEEX|nr:hypothetical protein CEXT_184451 [Caerostris extrusa]
MLNHLIVITLQPVSERTAISIRQNCSRFGLHFREVKISLQLSSGINLSLRVALWILRIILVFGVGTCAASVSYMPHEILMTVQTRAHQVIQIHLVTLQKAFWDLIIVTQYIHYQTLRTGSIQCVTCKVRINALVPKKTLTVRAEVHNLQESSPLHRRKVCTTDTSSIGSSSDWDSHSTSKTPTEPTIGREEANLPDRTSSSGSLHSSDIVSRSSSEHKNKTRESRLNLQEKESTFITGHSSNMESRSENRSTSTSSHVTTEVESTLEYSSEAYNSPAYASFSGSSTESDTENPENPQKRLK